MDIDQKWLDRNLLESVTKTEICELSTFTTNGTTYPNTRNIGVQLAKNNRDTFQRLSDFFAEAPLLHLALTGGGEEHEIPLTTRNNWIVAHSENPKLHWQDYFDDITNNDPAGWIYPYKSKVPTSYPAFPIRKLKGKIKRIAIRNDGHDQLSDQFINGMRISALRVTVPCVELQIVFTNKTITFPMYGIRTINGYNDLKIKSPTEYSTDPNIPTDQYGRVLERGHETSHYLSTCDSYYNSMYHIYHVDPKDIVVHGSFDFTNTNEDIGTYLIINTDIDVPMLDLVDVYMGTDVSKFNSTGINSYSTKYNLNPFKNTVSKPNGKLLSSKQVLPSIADIVKALGFENEVDMSEMVELKIRVAHKKYSYDDYMTCRCDGTVRLEYSGDAHEAEDAVLIEDTFGVYAIAIQYSGYVQNAMGDEKITSNNHPIHGTASEWSCTEYHSLYDTLSRAKYHSAHRIEYSHEWDSGVVYSPYVRLYDR